MWRQGDVLIEKVEELPATARKISGGVLAAGDTTTHKHRVRDPATATLYQASARRDLYLEVTAADACIEHPEHGPLDLSTGVYRVWRQREYTDGGERTILD